MFVEKPPAYPGAAEFQSRRIAYHARQLDRRHPNAGIAGSDHALLPVEALDLPATKPQKNEKQGER
jgi:hypothetical protein